jgi:6-phosphofructokinase
LYTKPQQKKGTAMALKEVNLKPNTMKSYHPSINSGQVSKNEVKAALKKTKKENAQDEISKSASNKTSITFKF